MKSSARNQFAGVVTQVCHGDIHSSITVALAGGRSISAVIPRDSCEVLKLAETMPVIALVKSSQIIIATDLDRIRLSAANQLHGMITHIERGAVNSIVTMDLGKNLNLTAAVTLQSTEQLDLHPGQYATAVFNACDVILGVVV